MPVRQDLFACQFFPAGVLATKPNQLMGRIFILSLGLGVFWPAPTNNNRVCPWQN
jgi:hypothetical protein